MNFQIRKHSFKCNERRKQKRFVFPFIVKYRLKGSPVFNTALFNNISLQGILLLNSTSHEPGSIVEIFFSFLEDNHLNYLSLEGILVWTKKNEKKINSLDWNLGVKLMPFLKDQEKILKRFLNFYAEKELESDYKFPVQARDFFIRGIQFFEKKPADAMIDFNRVIELSPEHSAAYYYRAFLKDRLGDPQGASEDLKKAYTLGGI